MFLYKEKKMQVIHVSGMSETNGEGVRGRWWHGMGRHGCQPKACCM